MLMTLQMTLLIPLPAQLALPVHGEGDLVQQQDGGVPHRLAGAHNLQLLHPALSHTCTHIVIYGEIQTDHNRKTEQMVQVNFSEHVLVYHYLSPPPAGLAHRTPAPTRSGGQSGADTPPKDSKVSR